jgi:nitrous oxide reductase accessory protein NosL
MLRRRLWILWLAAAFSAVAALGYQLSLDPYRPQTVGQEMRCPVCGMYPSLSPEWMTQIVFRDRGMIAFDSPLEMLRYLHDLPRYGKGRRAADIERIYVSDYAHGGWLRAEAAFFVAGARIRGPMRDENYPAFSARGDAEVFIRREGGEIRSYAQIAATPPPAHPQPSPSSVPEGPARRQPL